MMEHRVVGGRLSNGKVVLICACGEWFTSVREHDAEDLNAKSERAFRRHLRSVDSASERMTSAQK
jgi:hypothetical protein